MIVNLVLCQRSEFRHFALLHRIHPPLQSRLPRILPLVTRRFAPFLAATNFSLVAEKKLTAWMDRKPFLEHFGQERRHWHTPSRALLAGAFLFTNQYRHRGKIHVGHKHSQDFRATRAGVGCETDNWVDPAVRRARLHEIQEIDKVVFLFLPYTNPYQLRTYDAFGRFGRFLYRGRVTCTQF